MAEKENIIVKHKCAECQHEKICKYSEEYKKDIDIISNNSTVVATITIKCDFFKPPISSIR